MAEISRDELYNLVWAKPLVKLASEFGMSDVGLGKLCRRNRIPTPGRGYWEKTEAGQKVPRKKLPRCYSNNTVKMRDPLMLRPELETAADRLLDEALNGSKIEVGDTLRGTHPLVTRTSRMLGPEGSEKLIKWGSIPDQCLDVRVSKGMFRRALLVFDALIKDFEARGWPVRIIHREGMNWSRNETCVEILETQVQFSITGEKKLALQIGEKCSYGSTYQGLRRTWADGNYQRVEQCLNQFAAGLVQVAAYLHEERLEQERAERERKEIERQRQAAENARLAMVAKIEKEKARVVELENDAANWEQSNQIRKFVEARVAAMRQDAGIQEWARWANDQADRIDPLKKSPASIIDDEDKYRPPNRYGFQWQ